MSVSFISISIYKQAAVLGWLEHLIADSSIDAHKVGSMGQILAIHYNRSERAVMVYSLQKRS